LLSGWVATLMAQQQRDLDRRAAVASAARVAERVDGASVAAMQFRAVDVAVLASGGHVGYSRQYVRDGRWRRSWRSSSATSTAGLPWQARLASPSALRPTSRRERDDGASVAAMQFRAVDVAVLASGGHVGYSRQYGWVATLMAQQQRDLDRRAAVASAARVAERVASDPLPRCSSGRSTSRFSPLAVMLAIRGNMSVMDVLAPLDPIGHGMVEAPLPVHGGLGLRFKKG
jgi:hypothetical protein